MPDALGKTDGLKSLARRAELPIDRIRYVPNADESIVRSTRRGILFMMAFWSGPSLTAFSRLTEIVARVDRAAALELVVVDVDGSPAVYELPEFLGKVAGMGETAWIRDGTVVATSGKGMNLECFEPNTLALLAMP